MTKKNLKWRLTELPTGDEIAQLVSQNVITKDEAREMLFGNSSKDTEHLEERIKFLEGIVDTLLDKIGDPVTVYYPQRYERIIQPSWTTWSNIGVTDSTAGSVTYTAASTNAFSVQ